MKVADVCAAYLRGLEARNIRKSTKEGYQPLFRQLEAFARDADVDSLEEVDKYPVRRWREQWRCAYSTQRRYLA